MGLDVLSDVMIHCFPKKSWREMAVFPSNVILEHSRGFESLCHSFFFLSIVARPEYVIKKGGNSIFIIKCCLVFVTAKSRTEVCFGSDLAIL